MTSKKAANEEAVKTDESTATETEKVCGIIMPISSMADYDAEHWARVRLVLDEAIKDAKMKPRIVSEADEVTVIQSSIVQNLYDNEVVVCDVSGKNPNVMFELGLRLAFDKPTVIVQDDASKYIFDTGSIMHISYRRDLRYDDVRDFKTKVTAAIVASRNAAKDNEHYSPFLKHYGKFTVAKLETNEVSAAELLSKQLTIIQSEISRLGRRIESTPLQYTFPQGNVERTSFLNHVLTTQFEKNGHVKASEILRAVADEVTQSVAGPDDLGLDYVGYAREHLKALAPSLRFSDTDLLVALESAVRRRTQS